MPRTLLGGLLALALAVGVAPAWTQAQEDPPEEAEAPGPAEGPQPAERGEPGGGDAPLVPIEGAEDRPLEVDVVGPRPLLGPVPAEALRVIPGSGFAFDHEDLTATRRPTDLQEALRGQPGVHVRAEATNGFVPNIGIRGLNPDRSERMLFLEDGVPAGLAPYIENAAYYVPPFERIARLELLKGSGSLLYGPHTVGGVLNLITPDIPADLSGKVRTLVGPYGYAMGYAQAGRTVGPFGFLVSVLGETGDGFRDHSAFDMHDFFGKFRWTFSPSTNVTLKLNYYDQRSEETYLGLTTPMFRQNRFQNPARDDVLEVEWWSSQVTVQHRFSANLELLTNFYWSEATRDWNRQDFARNNGFAAPPADTIRTVGDPTVDGGAIYLRSSFGSRDRDFTKYGIEPRLLGRWCMGGREHEFHLGMRFHHEEMIDERNNRATLAADPVTRSRDIREVDAWAAFVQNRFSVTPSLDLTLGLRMEAYEQERRMRIASGMPVDLRGETDHVEWIPGAGFTWQAGRGVTLFGGVHRGFSPPRTAQAIDSAGDDLDLEPERSWNYELGLRGEHGGWARWEATGFYYDFSNQVVPANQSGGASTANTNAGETSHLGLELSGGVELFQALWRRPGPCGLALWLEGAYTYVDTENVTPGGTFRGKDLPYAPRHSGHVALRAEHPCGLTGGLFASYTGTQFGDQANTRTPSGDGTIGRIDDVFLLDASVRWRVPRTSLTLSASMNNVLDAAYVASRAPEGVFPGAPRQVLVGLEVEF